MPDIATRATDPRQYDNSDISWSTEADLNSPGRRFIWDNLASFYEELNGKNILDIGAGTGWFMHLAQKYQPRSVHGIEPSHTNCLLAQKWYSELNLRETSFEAFETSERFDLLFGLMIMGHIKDLAQFFKKSFELLRPGGRLFIMTGDFDYTRTPRFNYTLDVQEHDAEEHAITITRQQGVMAEVIRHPRRYIREAEQAEFKLSVQKCLPPTPDLLERDPKYQAFAGVPIAQLLVFEKTDA